MTTAFNFSGILFFPVTPFDSSGQVDTGLLFDHVSTRVGDGAGGVFAACGTGEIHALDAHEMSAVTKATVAAVAGRVPVIAGAGGSVAQARSTAREAEQAGADGVLLLPPYLVSGPPSGVERYVEAVVEASALPVIVYHRGGAQYSAAMMRRLASDPRVAGFKDGTGDVSKAQEIVAAVSEVRDDFAFFNGLLTAELSQGAYRGIGIPLYSSAAFAMAPAIANHYYRAYTGGDEALRIRILREFYIPLVALRDETPGFGVSLIKAGLRLGGVPVGGVRAPLVDPDERQLAILAGILDRGAALAEELDA